MKKNILVIYYSQTGQLKDIVYNLLQPFEREDDFNVDYYNICPEKPYEFPWSNSAFFDVFPESFQQIPIAIKAPNQDFLRQEYDLVILAYQIWFLTPSIPINSFLKSEYASQILNGRKVVTVIGCRNMWAKSQEKMRKLIAEAKGELVGNVAFVDRHLNHISVITIVHWMMGGKKNRKFGVFPKPGVSDEDIDNASQFGELILSSSKSNDYTTLQKSIIEKGGVNIKSFVILMDEKANKMFNIWSKFVLKNKQSRRLKLKFFKVYLIIAIWVLSPIVYVLFLVTYLFRIKRINEKKVYYSKAN